MGVPEKNLVLLERAKAGDNHAEEELVSTNLGLVRNLVRRFCNNGFEYDDLFQAGCIGLLKAIRSFDSSRGVMFSTYAVPVIAGEIKRYIRDNGPVKVSRSLKELAFKVHKIREQYVQEFEREPTASYVSGVLNVSSEEIVMAMDASAYPLSLDEPVNGDEGGREITLADAIGDDTFGENVDFIALKEALSVLTPQDRKLIVLRYFKDKTQKETAELLDMTQVQVSRREKKILDGLKKNLST